jgi:hypothetical protein
MNGKLEGADWGDPLFQVYDTGSDTWTEKDPMPYSVWMHGSALVGDTIYLIGGGWNNPLNTNWAYEPIADRWSSKAGMPSERGAPGVCALNGKIYAIGGFVGSTFLVKNEMYDPATDTWTEKAPMPTARAGLAVVATGGKIYAIGGTDSPGASLALMEVYDPGKDAWSPAAPMNSNRFGLVAASVGNKIFAIGGTPSNMTKSPGIAEIYDIAADEWESIDKLPIPTQWGTACCYNGNVYVMGGEDRCIITFPDKGVVLDNLFELSVEGITRLDDARTDPERKQFEIFLNPASGEMKIGFTMLRDGPVEVALYSLTGVLEAVLVRGCLSKGDHTLKYRVSGIPAGIYICRLNQGTVVAFQKLLLIE